MQVLNQAAAAQEARQLANEAIQGFDVQADHEASTRRLRRAVSELSGLQTAWTQIRRARRNTLKRYEAGDDVVADWETIGQAMHEFEAAINKLDGNLSDEFLAVEDVELLDTISDLLMELNQLRHEFDLELDVEFEDLVRVGN